MKEFIINCKYLTKSQINNKIRRKRKYLVNGRLRIIEYKHDDLSEIILPAGAAESSDSAAGSLIEFDCYYNKITSFAGLVLPDSLIKFDCSHNQITSFAGLTLPNSLKYFFCLKNQITSIESFHFPSSLIVFSLDSTVEFVSPKFESALRYVLRNKGTYDHKLYTSVQFIFLYLNFEINEYLLYDKILNLIQ
jgi:hypothetical protein